MTGSKNEHFGDFERYLTRAPAPGTPGFFDYISRQRGGAEYSSLLMAIADLSDGYQVVRHGLDWRDLEVVYSAVNSLSDPVPRDQQHNTAVYSLRSPEGLTALCLRVWGGHEGPEIMDVAVPIERSVSSAVVLEALETLDFLPGSWAPWLAATFDCWHEDGVWSYREPMQAVSVTLERVCFDVSPPMKEAVDILVPYEDAYPLDGNADIHGDAVYHYGAAALCKDDALAGQRPGFSSWMPRGAVLVRMIGPSAAAEFEALQTAAANPPAP